jgi:hypothetical protein
MAATSTTFTIIGLSKLLATVDSKIGKLPEKIPMALRSVGETYMTEAKRRTPVYHGPLRQGGTLRASGHVQGPHGSGRSSSVRLVFGGPAAPYAVFVHERLHARHTVGQAKYLESVVVERRSSLGADVARFL